MLPPISDIAQANTARMKIRTRSRTPPGGRRTNDSTFCFNPDASDAEGNSGDEVPMAKYPYLFIAEKTKVLYVGMPQSSSHTLQTTGICHPLCMDRWVLFATVEEARSTET